MKGYTNAASAPIPDDYNWSDDESQPAKKAKKSEPMTQSELYVAKRRAAYNRYCAKLKVLPKSRFLRQLGESYISMRNEFMRRKDLNCICATLLSDINFGHLDLGGNVLDERSINYVVQLVVGNKLLYELVLCECKLTTETLCMLTDGLLSNTSLETLDLSGNNIRDEDGYLVADIIKYTHLKTFKLSHNRLQEKAAVYIGDAIGSNGTLVSLDLSWNHFRGKGAECIAIGLVLNTTLETLDVSWNGFAFEGCCAFNKALAVNTTLETLDLTCNRIYPQALNELLKGVISNKTLLHLKLGHNPIGAMYTSTILTVVRDNPEVSLESLDLSGIVVDHEFDSVLKSLTKKRNIVVKYEKNRRAEKILRGNVTKVKNQKLPDIDPNRVSQFEEKNKKVIEIFNKVYRGSHTAITRPDVVNFLEAEGLPPSSESLDLLMNYFESEGGHNKVDFMELLQKGQIKTMDKDNEKSSNRAANGHAKDSAATKAEEPLKLPKIV